MRTYTQRDLLTDAGLDRLGDFLEGCQSGKAMNLEELDGFFAALIAGDSYAERVQPGTVPEFSSLDEARDILGLLMRH